MNLPPPGIPAASSRSRHRTFRSFTARTTGTTTEIVNRISGPQESREYRYSDTGRLTGVHTTAANLDIDIPYATDPAGNRLPDPELHPDSTFTAWPDNRIAEDAHYVYRYDEYGRLAERRRTVSRKVLSGLTTSAPTTITTTASTGWCSTRGYSMASHWSRAATSTTCWDGEWRNGCGVAGDLDGMDVAVA